MLLQVTRPWYSDRYRYLAGYVPLVVVGDDEAVEEASDRTERTKSPSWHS
jgi:hypothetical protein